MITDYFADLPDFSYNNFAEMLQDVSSRYPDNVALQMRTGASGYTKINFRELASKVDRLSAFLSSKGLLKGDHVAIISENRLEWCISYLGIVRAGMVVVPVDSLSEPSHAKRVIEYSDAKLLFHSQKYADVAKMQASQAGNGPLSVSFDNNFEGLLGSAPAIDLPDPSEIPPDHTASIIFTSGTTGLAKGVMLSHKGIISNINASIQSLPISSADNFVAVLPLHHSYPTTCSFLSPITVGGTVTIAERMVGDRIVANIRETGGTVLIGVPLLFDKIKFAMESKLADQPPFTKMMISVFKGLSMLFTRIFRLPIGRFLFRSLREKAGLSSLRLLVSGGGPLSSDTADFFEVLGFTIVQGYGMSENGPLISANTVRYHNNKSVGLPVKYTDIRITDKDKHGIGEIAVSSPSLMKGYYKNPEATKAMFTSDGYLKTGDLGRFDSKGFLHITGRRKNLIVTPGGKNVFPEEIEEEFADSGPIKEILIMGRPVTKNAKGEEVIAVCVPDSEYLREQYGEELSESTVSKLIKEEVARVNKKLESYKKISRVILRGEEFDKTSSQKIKRYLYLEYAK